MKRILKIQLILATLVVFFSIIGVIHAANAESINTSQFGDSEETTCDQTCVCVALENCPCCLTFTVNWPTNRKDTSNKLPLDDPWITFCVINSKPGKELDDCINGIPNKNPGDQLKGRADRNTVGIFEAIANLAATVCEDCVCVYDNESVTCD